KIDPKSWNPSDLHKELSRALSTVDESRTVYNEQRSRLQAAGGNEGDASLPDAVTDGYEGSAGRSFFQWFQIGVALTLPLIIFGAVALALFVWMASNGKGWRCFVVRPSPARRFVAGGKKLHDRKRTCTKDSKNSSGLVRRSRKSRKTGRNKDQKIIEPTDDSASRWRRKTSAKADVPGVLVRCAKSDETAKSFFSFFWWRLRQPLFG